MNKAIFTLIALAVDLAISPVASAQRFDFTYEGPDFTASDWFTIGGAPSPDGYYETAGDLTRGGTTFFQVVNPAGGRQDSGFAGHFPYLGGTYTFDYDDFFFANGTKDAGLDIYGLLFGNAFGTEFIDIWGHGKDPFDSFWAFIGHRLTLWDGGNDGTCGNGGVSPPMNIPEYGALSMLILSALALAGGFFFRARQSGSFLGA